MNEADAVATCLWQWWGPFLYYIFCDTAHSIVLFTIIQDHRAIGICPLQPGVALVLPPFQVTHVLVQKLYRSCAETVRNLTGFCAVHMLRCWGYFLGSFSTPSTLQYGWCIIMDDFTLVSHSWQLNGMHCWSWHLLRFGFATTHILYASSTVADSPHTYLLL